MMNIGYDWQEGLYGPKKAAPGTGQGSRERVYCKTGQHYAGPEDRVIWLQRPIGLSCEECAERVDPAAVQAERDRVTTEKMANAKRRLAALPPAPRRPAAPRKAWEHGTLYGYRIKACRCEPCKEVSRDSARRRYAERMARGGVARPVATPKPPEEWTHGTTQTYTARKCRCEPCRKAKAEAMRRQRAARAARPVQADAIEHGTVRGYDYYRCRCQPCTEANSEKNRESHQARKARQSGRS